MSLFEKSNKELLESVSALNSGKVVFLGSLPTKNEAIRQGFFAQIRSDVATTETNTNEVLNMFLGFSNNQERVIRCVQSYKPELMKLEEGQALPEGINIQVTDAMEPFYVGQVGRKRPDGSEILKAGKAIYRKESLVSGEPKHNLIKDYDHIAAPVTQESTAKIAEPTLIIS